MSAELVIGICALIVAALSVVTSWRTSKRQVLLQERLLSIEHARERERRTGLQQAQLFADLLPSHNSSYRLRIRNEGPGQARAVAVLVDGEPIETSEHVRVRGEVVRTLGAGADVKYHVMSYIGMKPVYLVRLEWVDDSSDERNWESQLSI